MMYKETVLETVTRSWHKLAAPRYMTEVTGRLLEPTFLNIPRL